MKNLESEYERSQQNKKIIEEYDKTLQNAMGKDSSFTEFCYF